MDNYQKFKEFCNNLLNVNASVNMAPLGGCKPFKLEDYPEDSRPFLQAYVDRDCCESGRLMSDKRKDHQDTYLIQGIGHTKPPHVTDPGGKTT